MGRNCALLLVLCALKTAGEDRDLLQFRSAFAPSDSKLQRVVLHKSQSSAQDVFA